MVKAPQFGLKSSNQQELANFRHAPFAKANLNYVTVSEEQAAANLAAEGERKAANKAKRQTEEAEAQKRQEAERLPQKVSRVGCITALPNEEGLKAVHSFMVRKSGTSRPTSSVIPADLLARGLADDHLREQERCAEERAELEEEAARQERFRVGYIQDVVSSALGHLRREDINLEAKVLLLEAMSCHFSANARNGRDAIYLHAKSGAEIIVRGGTITDSNARSTAQDFMQRSNMSEEQRRAAERRQKSRNAYEAVANSTTTMVQEFDREVITPEQREERRLKNIANANAQKAAKEARQAVERAKRMPKPKAEKPKKKEETKKKKSGEQR